ncbi:MAG: class I SAM-dependent methyltransferase [Chloroflexota bacterium]
MNWVKTFYTKQNEWMGHVGDIEEHHREKAALINELAGSGPKRVLECGAGRGESAAAAVELGHSVVAIDITPVAVENARRLAEQMEPNKMTVIEGDFYTLELNRTFDVVCYWDGFGVGSDQDQRRLLNRIANWLEPNGCALIDIYTPWHAASVAGTGWQVGQAMRQYDFDADACCWLDSWWPIDDKSQTVTQRLRCYGPADLRMLLAGTGLRLNSYKSGGYFDWELMTYLADAPLGKSMFYTAKLVLV